MTRLFAVALLAVLTAVGVAVSALGWVALTAYVVIVVSGAVALSVLRVRQERRQAAGRTCSCCTSTVFDPVEVR